MWKIQTTKALDWDFRQFCFDLYLGDIELRLNHLPHKKNRLPLTITTQQNNGKKLTKMQKYV